MSSVDVVNGQAWRAPDPYAARGRPLGSFDPHDLRGTRIGDRPEWRLSYGLAPLPERRRRGPSISSGRPGASRHLCRRWQSHVSGCEPSCSAGFAGPFVRRSRLDAGSGIRAPGERRLRARQRSSDRPYWIPSYGMYAGLSPEEIFFARR